jgi:N-acyl-phosphatidylethanolamine-hydrolysing phospholipase D
MLVVLLTSLASCTTVNPAYNPAKKHHRPDGFQNNYTEATDKSRTELLKWQWQRLMAPAPTRKPAPTPEVKADLGFVLANKGASQQPATTWVGHSTMLLQMAGLNILTDPVFSNRASPVSFAGPKRLQAPGLRLDELPRIDVVVLSHNHYDHLDTESVVALNRQAGGPPLFVVPLGVKAWFANEGITHVRELDWWDSVSLPATATTQALEVHFTPVQHWSARGLNDRRATLWGGFALFAPDFHAYYSGDTGYSLDFVDTQKHFAARHTPQLGGGFDLAFIAVGAYEPRWFMKEQHVNPAEAVQIFQDLKAKRAVGVHWGTFILTDELSDEPAIDLAKARTAAKLAEDSFTVMAVGETRKFAKRMGVPGTPAP